MGIKTNQMSKISNKTEIEKTAISIKNTIDIIKGWNTEAIQVNAKWLKTYLQPNLDKLYKLEENEQQ